MDSPARVQTKELPGLFSDPLSIIMPSSLGNAAKAGGGLPASAGIAEEVADGGGEQGDLGSANSGEEGIFPLDDDVTHGLLVLVVEALDEFWEEALIAEISVFDDGLRGDEEEAVVFLAAREDRNPIGRDIRLGELR